MQGDEIHAVGQIINHVGMSLKDLNKEYEAAAEVNKDKSYASRAAFAQFDSYWERKRSSGADVILWGFEKDYISYFDDAFLCAEVMNRYCSAVNGVPESIVRSDEKDKCIKKLVARSLKVVVMGKTRNDIEKNGEHQE
ncbi:conserved hypothetical protein [delta proteobacterium NaphS2]|nr:conserved hypothetical protein [delta proteobacterium NaphS2]